MTIKTVRLYTTKLRRIELQLTDEALYQFKNAMHTAFYDHQGNLRPRPLGKIEIYAEDGTRTFQEFASELLPAFSVTPNG